tara:strand:+ start:416 stop:580 length:165 start_codon:yes stop_codon:yes gene_type:complete
MEYLSNCCSAYPVIYNGKGKLVGGLDFKADILGKCSKCKNEAIFTELNKGATNE